MLTIIHWMRLILQLRERTIFKPMSRSVTSRGEGGWSREKFLSERDMPKKIPMAKNFHWMVGRRPSNENFVKFLAVANIDVIAFWLFVGRRGR